MPVVMKPECSATPMPSMATSTVPTGPKVTKFVTMPIRKDVTPDPVSWLMITIGSPERGSMTSKVA